MPVLRRLCQEANLSSHRVAHNGVWITDDVLSDAFNRFLRLSPIAKRYGSNVPGPLEAQRRLAKRRMMALAGVGAMSAADPAALFGMDGPKLGKIRWQPPDRGKKSDEGSQTNTSWLERLGLKPIADTSPSLEERSETFALRKGPPIRRMRPEHSVMTADLDIVSHLKNVSVGQMPELATLAQAHGWDHTEFCKTAFGSLLRVREIRWEHVLEFLLNPQLNVTEARHLTSLTLELGRRSLTLVEYKAGKELIEGCLKLGLVFDEEIPRLIEAACKFTMIQTSSTADSDATDANNHCESLIEAIWRGMKACRIRSIQSDMAPFVLANLPRSKRFHPFRMELYQHIYPLEDNADKDRGVGSCLASWAIHSFSLNSSIAMDRGVLTGIIKDLHPILVTKDVIVEATTILLEKILRSNGTETDGVNGWATVLNGWLLCLREALAYRVWSPALEVIASRHISPLDLDALFSRLTPAHLACEALLRYWFPRLPVPPAFESLKHQSLEYDDTVSHHDAARKLSIATWTGVLQEFRFLHQERYRNSPHLYDTFAWLLIALHRRQQITLANQQMLISLCEQRFDAYAVSQICEYARDAGVYFYPVPMAEVITRLAKEQPRVALSLYNSRNIYLSRMPDLLCDLIKDGAHSLEIFKMLQRPDPDCDVPIGKRENFKNDMTQGKIDLLHDCADAFSKQEQSSPRTRFRNVYLCYRYLKDRAAPMSPLMSRALVRAGITNYLTAGINVSQKQAKWVLEIVERIEGHDIAQELDTLVWRWMQKVFAAWNKRTGGMKRPHLPPPHTRFTRRISGVLKGVRPSEWEMDHAKVPRRIRWYLDNGKLSYSNLDTVFHKRLRIKFRRLPLKSTNLRPEVGRLHVESRNSPSKFRRLLLQPE